MLGQPSQPLTAGDVPQANAVVGIAAYRQRADEREQFLCGCIVNRLHRSMKMGLEFLEVVELVGKAEQQTQSSRRKQICEGIDGAVDLDGALVLCGDQGRIG